MTDPKSGENGAKSGHVERLGLSLARLEGTTLPYRSRLAERISQLSASLAEDYTGGVLSSCATDALIDFLQAPHSPGYPDLTATPAGDLYAEWRRSDGHLLTIEFLDSGEVRYLVFRPNPRHPNKVDRLNGTTTADALSASIVELARLGGLAA